jgi:septal ring factor EnvC (AmiA/AmiB activator)
MEQLAALDVEPRDQDSAAKSLTALKNESAEEKLARKKV